jgi:hypothetical protein
MGTLNIWRGITSRRRLHIARPLNSALERCTKLEKASIVSVLTSSYLVFDADQEQAIASRLKIFQQKDEEGFQILGAHITGAI